MEQRTIYELYGNASPISGPNDVFTHRKYLDETKYRRNCGREMGLILGYENRCIAREYDCYFHIAIFYFVNGVKIQESSMCIAKAIIPDADRCYTIRAGEFPDGLEDIERNHSERLKKFISGQK